ncbi:hypothetical protein [Chitinophaga rhizosphaerae]|uniref:hypothetical protein n=1 Tax=Chitinophaga rhizosphaerae TaxID=1864947 RepID=UPI000F811E73|nr:hypothetical protein [Chitinophaga rhizosphaerae]
MFNGLNSVTFSNFPIEERKVNFFVDFYQYCNHFAGKINNHDLDTPTSICAKLIFQLENNKDKRGVKFVKNHLKRLAVYSNIYASSFAEFQPLMHIWERWIQADGNYTFLRDNLSEFTSLSKALHTQLEANLISHTVERIKEHLLTNESLETLKEGLSFFTKILVAETIIGRRSRNEARELFSEIMTNDYRKFPYPAHINTSEEKRRFFNAKNIVVILDAIKNFAHAPVLEQYIYFRIPGLELADNSAYEHNNTKIYPKSHPDVKGMLEWLSTLTDPDIKNFFEGKIISIGEVKVKSATVKGAYKLAKNNILNTTRYIGAVLDKSIHVDIESYLHTENKVNFGWNIRFINGKAVIHENERLQLEDNAFDRFKDDTCHSGWEFVKHEQYYIQAQIDQNISNLWAYLEFVLSNPSTSLVPAEVAAAILVLDETEFQFWSNLHYLRNTIDSMNTNCKRIGLDIDQQQAMLNDLDKFKEYGPLTQSDLFQYGFSKMMNQSNLASSESRREQYRFYIEIMNETYEQRNLIQHQGISCEAAVTKLNSILPFIFARIRHVLFEYAKRYPTKNRTELIEQIKVDTANWREV